MVSKSASNFCILLAIDVVALDSLAPATFMSSCFQRIVNLYLSFINMVKLNTLWRYEGCSITLEVIKIKMRWSQTVCVMSPLLYIHFTK